jgi:hypothetical protein
VKPGFEPQEPAAPIAHIHIHIHIQIQIHKIDSVRNYRLIQTQCDREKDRGEKESPKPATENPKEGNESEKDSIRRTAPQLQQPPAAKGQ